MTERAERLVQRGCERLPPGGRGGERAVAARAPSAPRPLPAPARPPPPPAAPAAAARARRSAPAELLQAMCSAGCSGGTGPGRACPPAQRSLGPRFSPECAEVAVCGLHSRGAGVHRRSRGGRGLHAGAAGCAQCVREPLAGCRHCSRSRGVRASCVLLSLGFCGAGGVLRWSWRPWWSCLTLWN